MVIFKKKHCQQNFLFTENNILIHMQTSVHSKRNVSYRLLLTEQMFMTRNNITIDSFNKHNGLEKQLGAR